MGAMAAWGVSGPAIAGESAASSAAVTFARVGTADIPLWVYQMALVRASRERFYHGRPADSELAAFHKEVAQEVIDHELLRQEAERRRLQVDPVELEEALQRNRERNEKRGKIIDEESETWKALVQMVNGNLLVDSLHSQVLQEVTIPTEDEAQAYYREAPGKFTEPERLNLSSILLRVDPAASRETWEAAAQEGQDIYQRLQDGADFAELARLHSGDASAPQGGELGYVHKGMLNDSLQAVIDNMQPGQIAEPMRILEGVAIFRLNDRKPAQLMAFAEIRDRAIQLLHEDKKQQAWQGLIEKLRKDTPVEINEKFLLEPENDSVSPGHGDAQGT